MKSVKNFPYVEKTSAECNEDSYLAILHLSRVVARKIDLIDLIGQSHLQNFLSAENFPR